MHYDIIWFAETKNLRNKIEEIQEEKVLLRAQVLT